MRTKEPLYQTQLCWVDIFRPCAPHRLVKHFISYMGMKSWDLHVCDRASTITHVDRVKKAIPDSTRYDSTFACFDAICTQFNVTWPHCGTVRDFLAVLTDPDCRHESDFSQRDGSDSTCGRRVHAVQNKTPEQTSVCFACKYGPP